MYLCSQAACLRYQKSCFFPSTGRFHSDQMQFSPVHRRSTGIRQNQEDGRSEKTLHWDYSEGACVSPPSFKDRHHEMVTYFHIPFPPSHHPPALILPPQLVLNDRTIPITVGSAGGINVANSAHPCAESPCANGGTCRPKWDSYECDCPLGYDGKHCQKGQLNMWVCLFDFSSLTRSCCRTNRS